MNPWIHCEFLKQIPDPNYYILGHNWSHTKSVYAAFWGEMCKYFSKWSHLQFLSCRKKKEHPRNPSGQPHDNTLLSWRHHSHVFRTCKNLVLCVCVLVVLRCWSCALVARLTQGLVEPFPRLWILWRRAAPLICMSMAGRLATFRCTQKASHSDTHWSTKSHPISLSPLQFPQSMHSPATAYWQRASGTIPRRNVGSILLFAPSPQSEQRLQRKGRTPPLKKGGERGEALGRAEAGGGG